MSASEFFKINNEILPPHDVSGVMEEVWNSVHLTSLQCWRNFLHIFSQHETENVRTTTRHNITTCNFACIFFRTSSFQSCVCSLHYQRSHVASVKFPTAQISIKAYAYAFTQNVCTGVLFALSGWFFHRWCNNLWAKWCLFYFFYSRCSRLVTELVSLIKTQSCNKTQKFFLVFFAPLP